MLHFSSSLSLTTLTATHWFSPKVGEITSPSEPHHSNQQVSTIKCTQIKFHWWWNVTKYIYSGTVLSINLSNFIWIFPFLSNFIFPLHCISEANTALLTPLYLSDGSCYFSDSYLPLQWKPCISKHADFEWFWMINWRIVFFFRCWENWRTA